MRPVLFSVFMSMVSLTAAAAQSVAPIDTLFRAVGLPQVIEIMRQEGQGYGDTLEEDLFPGRGGVRWAATVEEIYNVDRMSEAVRIAFDSDLAAADLAPMISFFDSPLGQRIVELEVSARRAMLEPSVDEASREALADMIEADDPRLELLRAFSDANELIETNVTGAMNANYAFYTGLATGGAFNGTLTEEDILADVWSQEPTIRDDTEEWLFSYLAMAYQPLSDDDLQAYIAFSETDAGRALNLALFAAFDEMFVAVSLALGQAASEFFVGQEL